MGKSIESACRALINGMLVQSISDEGIVQPGEHEAMGALPNLKNVASSVGGVLKSTLDPMKSFISGSQNKLAVLGNGRVTAFSTASLFYAFLPSSVKFGMHQFGLVYGFFTKPEYWKLWTGGTVVNIAYYYKDSLIPLSAWTVSVFKGALVSLTAITLFGAAVVTFQNCADNKQIAELLRPIRKSDPTFRDRAWKTLIAPLDALPSKEQFSDMLPSLFGPERKDGSYVGNNLAREANRTVKSFIAIISIFVAMIIGLKIYGKYEEKKNKKSK